MTADVQVHEDGSLPDAKPEHFCLNGRRCVDKIDGHPRETNNPDTLCPACMDRAADRVKQLPKQYMDLRKMIGDRHAGVDVNIKHAKPSSTVLLNLHVDSLAGHIVTDITAAAEVVAEKMAMRDKNGDPWDANRPDLAEQVQACARILNPNVHVLINARGVGGREDNDPSIDVMFWNHAGTMRGVTQTTGLKMVQRLDYLSSLAHFTLGQTLARTDRVLPCNRCRAHGVGRWAGSDQFDCVSCGARFDIDDVRRQDKFLVEALKRKLIDPADLVRDYAN